MFSDCYLKQNLNVCHDNNDDDDDNDVGYTEDDNSVITDEEDDDNVLYSMRLYLLFSTLN